MKYHFIINPEAGKGRLASVISERIKSSAKAAELDTVVYYTTCVGDAEDYVRRVADGTEQVFFACGGDGTLCEVANGIMSLDNREGVYLGTVPSGTGNDFVRNFQGTENFSDIDAQLSGSAMDIDLISCNDRYAVNMVNIGFDCEVVCAKEELQERKILPSKFAYIAGLVLTLVKKPGVKCGISFDGAESQERDMLLTTYANGEFCGGGFHSNPRSTLTNGYINALTVDNVSRIKFLSVVGSYKNGTHLKHTDIIADRMAETVEIDFGGTRNICIDGEVLKTDKLLMKKIKSAVKFWLPAGCEYKKTVESQEPLLV